MRAVRIILLPLMLTLFVGLVGCQPQQPGHFAVREELKKLPEKHQRQIGDELKKFYGTETLPTFYTAAVTEEPTEGPPKLIARHASQHLQFGRQVYLQQCAGCHGVTGDGQGPAAKFLDPLPRDYRLGKFKFISTPRGSKPRRADLVRLLRRGAKGTSMPAFRWMPEDELNAVVDYVILLSSRGELEYRMSEIAAGDLTEDDDVAPESAIEQTQGIATTWTDAEGQIVRPLTPELSSSQESIEEGAQAFVRLNCYKCHGADGRGNKAANNFKDDWGHTAVAADLTTGTLHGGARPIDLYRRIYSGINGTPMPSFALPDTSLGETELQRSETIWKLTHFIRHVASGKPVPADVISAEIRKQVQAENEKANKPASDPPAASPPAGDAPATDEK